MSNDYAKLRGTIDIYGEEIIYYNYVTSSLRIISNLYGFSEIITPIFEGKNLFSNNIGDDTDIVTKEFYDFKDKGGRDVVLRPEGTLPVIRSVVENKLTYTETLPLKYFYIGPMFRYERPQSGRQRQFTQYGVEYIGIKNNYQQVEIILLALNILNTFKIKNFSLKINYIGSLETRTIWIEELRKYFLKYKKDLTEDSINRLKKNPLRILDDKIDSKKEFVKNAPKIDDFLTEKEVQEKNELINLLNTFKINFEFDSTMVRGLDYYSGLVFEFVSNLNILNNQSTIIGGGKYENIFSKFGQDNLVCIGFAIGIERLIVALKQENPIDVSEKFDIYFANLIENNVTSLFIISLLRSAGFAVESNLATFKLDKHFKIAEKKNPKIILILGQKELSEEKIIIKNQDTKKEKLVKIDLLLKEIQKIFK